MSLLVIKILYDVLPNKKTTGCDHYLMNAQLLKHSQNKSRPFFNSPIRWLLKNVQNLEIWVNIGRDIQGILKASRNKDFNLLGLWLIICFFFLKQNGSCFSLLSFIFFCLRKENIDSLEWIHAIKIHQNDRMRPDYGNRPNLWRSEGSGSHTALNCDALQV